jgi:protease II
MVRKLSEPKGRQLLDAGSLASGGKNAAIFDVEPSWNGKYVAVGLQPDGVMRVVRVSDGALLKDAIQRTVDGDASWNDDDSSFYYRAFQNPPASSSAAARADNMRAYIHRLGDDSELDQPVFGPDVTSELHLPKSEYINAFPIPETTLQLAVQSSDPAELDDFWVRDLAKNQPRWRQIADHKDDILFEFATRQSQFFYVTTAQVPNGRVMSFDVSKEDVSNAVEILPQSDLVLSDSPRCSWTIRTARSRISGENLFDLFMVLIPFLVAVFVIDCDKPGRKAVFWNQAVSLPHAQCRPERLK